MQRHQVINIGFINTISPTLEHLYKISGKRSPPNEIDKFQEDHLNEKLHTLVMKCENGRNDCKAIYSKQKQAVKI